MREYSHAETKYIALSITHLSPVYLQCINQRESYQKGDIVVKKAMQAIPNNLLRTARKERGWTQQHVADQIGAPLSLNVTRWERGTTVPSTLYAHKLCQLFGKSLQELGLWEDVLSSPSPSEENVVQASGPLWNVPYRRNPFFTGRDDLLTLLRQQFCTADAVALTQSYALHGLGGIGKTQLAIEYVYRCQEAYQAIFWIRAASRETLIADFVQLATFLRLPGSDTQDQMSIVDAVKRWLNQHDGWLLILDNADELALLTDFLPTGTGGHLLLTTRASATGKIAPSIAVEKMSLEEGCLLLLRRANLLPPTVVFEDIPMSMRTQAQELVQALDGLPLALDQAAAYIEETGCGLRGYLELYQQYCLDLLQWQRDGSSDYPNSVASTWLLSFQQVEEADPAAANLLRLCAFLDPDAISEVMLGEGAEGLDPLLRSEVADLFQLNRMIGVLRRFSLIQRDTDARVLNIHRLVQAVLKGRMDEHTRLLWAEHTVRMVNAAFPEVALQTWSRCEQCLPHAMNCAALIEQYQLISSEAGRLLTYAGWYLGERGWYEQAHALLSQALSLREQLLGPEHLETITTLVCLGELYQNQGKYKQAESYLQRALVIREQALGSDHADVALVLHILGTTNMFAEQYQTAEMLLQRALRIREHTCGPEKRETASTLLALAQNNVRWGRYATAEAFFMRVLPLYERIFGLEHPEAAIVLNMIGLLYTYQGKYELAKTYTYRSLQYSEKVLGLEHPETATKIGNLGLIYSKMGNFEEAAALYRRVLPIHESMQGPEHPYTGGALYNLANVYTLQGKYELAEPLYLRSLTIYENAVGKESVDVGITLRGLAYHYYLQGRYELAETLGLRALTIFERVLDPENARTAAVLHLLAGLYAVQGRSEEAQKLYQRGISMSEHVLGLEHPDTSAIRKDYSNFQITLFHC